MTKYEQETIITFNAAENTANVWSCDPVWMRKIKKIDGWKEYSAGVEVDVPKNWIKVQKPRELSKIERERLSERMKALRALQKK